MSGTNRLINNKSALENASESVLTKRLLNANEQGIEESDESKKEEQQEAE